MNETVKKFLDSINIDYEGMQDPSLLTVKKQFEINRIFDRFQFYKEKANKNVSIADVVGYDYSSGLSNNIVENMDKFFNKDGDTYHTRSLSMLDIPQERIMEQLVPSFIREPISLKTADEGDIYLIADNGLHRFHVMKLNYLAELSKLDPNDQEKKKQLKEKYTFGAVVFEIDVLKSYSAYLLSLLDNDIIVEDDYDFEKYVLTGKVCIKDKNSSDKITLDDQQLVQFVKKQVKKCYESGEDMELFEEKFKEAYERYPSFRKYCKESLKPQKSEEESWDCD